VSDNKREIRSYDTRFAGADRRMIQILESYGSDLAGLDADALPEALVNAIRAHGVQDTEDMRELVINLIRAAAERCADRPKPRKISKTEQLKRRRLHLLAHVLMEWARRDGKQTRHLSGPWATHVRGLEDVYRTMADREGADPDTIKHWCATDKEARSLIAALRPVNGPP